VREDLQDVMARRTRRPWPSEGAVPQVHIDDTEIQIEYQDAGTPLLELMRMSRTDLDV
jgi:hypothetical protein